MAETWDFRSPEHREVFSRLLAPLIVASRSRDFADAARAKDQLIAWVMGLKDVPLAVLEAGVERLVGQGVTWMPKPGDLRAACAVVVEERRQQAARLAQALREDCPDCHGTGWQDTGEAVTRCTCHARALALLSGVDAPIRLALPSGDDSA